MKQETRVWDSVNKQEGGFGQAGIIIITKIFSFLFLNFDLGFILLLFY